MARPGNWPTGWALKTGAVLPGAGVGSLAADLIAHGTDTVYTIDDPRLTHYQSSPYARVVSTLGFSGADRKS